jgi:predicted ArsR family transcriptional regulator
VHAVAGAGAARASAKDAEGSGSDVRDAFVDETGAPAPSDRRFAAAVAAVTAAFGDPTRREIYLHVRSTPGTTASEVAAVFSLHPNVARHHLDRLAAGGYLEVTLERPPSAGAGRPSKRYKAADAEGADPTVEMLGRRDDLLVSLLGEALTLLGPDDAERMAERVGEKYGRALAERMEPGEGQRSLRAAMHTVADALTAQGFAAHAEDRGTATAVVAEQCPFGEAASAHPVICAVDRGMVRGLLAGLCGEMVQGSTQVVLSSRARGDDACAALV